MGEQKGKIKRRIGIVRGPYRSKVDGSTQALMPRTCLACGKMFKSDLPVRINRICPKCRYLESRDNGMSARAPRSSIMAVGHPAIRTTESLE